MNFRRLLLVWATVFSASLGAILAATGGRVFPPATVATRTEVAPTGEAPAFLLGKGEKQLGFTPEGAFALTQFVESEGIAPRTLRQLHLESPLWQVVPAVEGATGQRRSHLQAPLLEIYALRRDPNTDLVLGEWLQLRLRAEEGEVTVSGERIAKLDPQVPVLLREAIVEFDEDGDGHFESELRAPLLECELDVASVRRRQRGGPGESAIRRLVARGSDDSPESTEEISCRFGTNLFARARSLVWTPEELQAFPSLFEFGPDFVAEIREELRRANDAPSLEMSWLRAPGGAVFKVALPEVVGEPRPARLVIEDDFELERERSDGAGEQERFELAGRDATIDLELLGDLENSGRPGRSEARDGARLVRVRIREEVRAAGEFGDWTCPSADARFSRDERSRLVRMDCTGPVVLAPSESAEWIEDLLGPREGLEGAPLELTARGGATLVRPEGFDPERDAYELELRDTARFGTRGEVDLLRASRTLSARLEETIPTEGSAPASRSGLQPVWLEADGEVFFERQAQVGQAEHLHVDFVPGERGSEARAIHLEGTPSLRIRPRPEDPLLDLSCEGPLDLLLSAGELERAELDRKVVLRPVEPHAEAIELHCDHLVVQRAGTGEEELAFEARGSVHYEQAGRVVRCERMVRNAAGRIDILGVPAVIEILHEGEPVLLRALWIGYDPATGSFAALGLAQRVLLEPPTSLLEGTFDPASAAGGPKKDPPPGEGEVSDEPPPPTHVRAFVVFARLGEVESRVVALGNVEIDGKLLAHADLLTAASQEDSRLRLGSLPGRRARVHFSEPGRRVDGSAHAIEWSEKHERLILRGQPRARWNGGVDSELKLVAPKTSDPSGKELPFYRLRADRELVLEPEVIHLRGRALIRSESDSSLRIAARNIRLDRDRTTGKPRKLSLIEDADLISGDELQVVATRIDWDARRSELVVRGNRERNRRAQFRLRGQEDQAWLLSLDLENLLILRIERT